MSDKEIMTAEEFIKTKPGVFPQRGVHHRAMIIFAEAYHKHRVESVSDEEIKNHFDIPKSEIMEKSLGNKDLAYRLGIATGAKIEGAKWLRNYLLTDK